MRHTGLFSRSRAVIRTALVACLLLGAGNEFLALGAVTIGNPALCDSPFGPDVTDSRTAGYQVAYVSVDILNTNTYAVSVTWSVAIDGTTVASDTQIVNASTSTTSIRAAPPAPVLTAGSHIITAISGSVSVAGTYSWRADRKPKVVSSRN